MVKDQLFDEVKMSFWVCIICECIEFDFCRKLQTEKKTELTKRTEYVFVNK